MQVKFHKILFNHIQKYCDIRLILIHIALTSMVSYHELLVKTQVRMSPVLHASGSISFVHQEFHVRCNLSNMSKQQSEKINMWNHKSEVFRPHIRQKCQKLY